MDKLKKYFIITGASKGLGAAFAEVLLDPNNVLFLISRSRNPDMSDKAIIKNCHIHQVSFDLSETEKLPELLAGIIDHIPKEKCGGIYLINNAAVTEPVMPIEQADAVAIDAIINVNFRTPVLLTSWFISTTKKYPVEKKILNITSGSASIPHHGMSMYCSTKAALDMFSLSVSREQSQQENPVEIHAISPGFLNTEMPNSLLQKSKSEFAEVEDFALAKKNGKFADPAKVASQIIKLWQRDKLEHGKVSHLSDY